MFPELMTTRNLGGRRALDVVPAYSWAFLASRQASAVSPHFFFTLQLLNIQTMFWT